MPHAVVRPDRLRVPSSELHTTVVRVIGYRWSCSCGETGPRCDGYGDARLGMREHADTHAAAASEEPAPPPSSPPPGRAAEL